MPQFDFARVFFPQVAWLAICFLVLYFGVVRFTLPKLGRVMNAREDRISGDLAAARAAKDAADAAASAYHAELAQARDHARHAIADAKLSAAQAGEGRLHAASAEVAAQATLAETRIAAAVADAQAAIRDIAADGAVAIVARLTGAEADSADAQARVAALIGG